MGLLTLSLLAVPVNAADEVDAFTEGSVWVTENDTFDEPLLYEIYSIEGESIQNGQILMNLWQRLYSPEDGFDSGNKFYGYISRRGEEIWYTAPGDEPRSWKIYDFSLNVGDYTHVDGLYYSYGHPLCTHTDMLCTSIAQENYNGFDYTVFELVDEEFSPTSTRWIKGIGDVRGFSTNNAYQGMGNILTKLTLVQVIVNGEIVYGDNVVGLELLNSENATSAVSYDLQGRMVSDQGHGLVIEDGQVVMKR